MAVNREDVLLAVLSAANGRAFTPTQLQKALFLLSKNMPDLFNQDSTYQFSPYNYGPFDKGIYSDAQRLSSKGLIEITESSSGKWKEYSASDRGIQAGAGVLATLSSRHRLYVERVVEWVRSLSFPELVKAIYDSYPEMRVNSIFKG